MELGKRENNQRRKLLDEEGDAVREYKAMHEENFWSSWPKEERKVKRKEKPKLREKWKKREKEEKRRGERRERNDAEEDVRVFVSVEAIEIWRVVEMFLGTHCGGA